MNPEEEHIDEFERLGRFLAGESSPEEIAWVERWLAESEDNRKVFDGLAEVWTLGESAAAGPINVDAAWDKVSNQLGISNVDEAETHPLGGVEKNRSWKRWLMYAAVLLVPLAGFIYLTVFSSKQHDLITLATAKGEVKTVNLPDGTVVTLNESSTLVYPDGFDDDRRQVELEGEAFFEVARDTSQPFYVQAKSAAVKVLGTSFNVKARKREVSVSVVTGKVKFGGRFDHNWTNSTELEAGDAATYHLDLETLDQKEEDSENVLFWKNRILRYQDTRLETVAEEVSDFYPGKLIIKNPELNNCLIDASYEDQTIEEIANLIAFSFNLEVTQDGNDYILDGESCD